MTIHCAITYFDSENESVGYLLGSDSRVTIKEISGDSSQKKEIVFQVDKSFRGRETVGFIRGTILGDQNNPSAGFSRDMQSLENLFDDIEEGTDYSNVPLLQDSEQYVLMIGKQTNGFLDLYTVSNARKKTRMLLKDYTD